HADRAGAPRRDPRRAPARFVHRRRAASRLHPEDPSRDLPRLRRPDAAVFARGPLRHRARGSAHVHGGSVRKKGGLAAGVLAALTGIVALPEEAHANGRFPSAEQLVVDPGDPNHIAVQVTYGFIHTVDAGRTWTWTCEDAAQYGGELDPPIALLDG